MSTIESVSHEARVFEPPRRIRRAGERHAGRIRRAQRRGRSRLSPGSGRSSRASSSPGTSRSPGRSTNRKAPFYKWFEDGELNVSYNCLDRNLENGNANKVAIIFEADDGAVTRVTYQELYQRVCRFANGLKSLGISKGDRVIIYMPMSIEGVVAMQACARIGATHSVVFGGFSAKSLQERIIDAGAVAVITADEQVRGGKHLPLKAIVDEALGMGGCESSAQRDRLPAHRRQRRVRGAARPVDARARREAARHLRAGMGRRRASAVHPLHLRLDRQAEGRAAQLRRLPAVGDR